MGQDYAGSRKGEGKEAMTWDQRGHSDWSGMIWAFIVIAVLAVLVETGLVVMTVILWKYVSWRILFGVLSIAGILFILTCIKEIWY